MKLETIGSYKFSFADHHGPPKVNFWQDPMSPSKWKEEHVSLFTSLNFNTLVPRFFFFSLLFHFADLGIGVF